MKRRRHSLSVLSRVGGLVLVDGQCARRRWLLRSSWFMGSDCLCGSRKERCCKTTRSNSLADVLASDQATGCPRWFQNDEQDRFVRRCKRVRDTSISQPVLVVLLAVIWVLVWMTWCSLWWSWLAVDSRFVSLAEPCEWSLPHVCSSCHESLSLCELLSLRVLPSPRVLLVADASYAGR